MVEVRNLKKSYPGRLALKGVSFSVDIGEIVGFLGPNGAGKSTAMNIISGYISASQGTVTINGHDILSDAENAKKEIGYLPEQVPLYPDMTVDEYLGFIFELKKCNLNRKKHLDEICNAVKIEDIKGRLIKNLSKGYRQRVGIAQALIGNPPIIILDEPTVGLDPKQIVEVRNLIRILGRDHAIILSTHILSEVQAVCDRTIIINNGEIIADEMTEEISNLVGHARRIKAIICGPDQDIYDSIRKINGVTKVQKLVAKEADAKEFIIECAEGHDIRRDLFKMVCDNSWIMIGLENMGIKLEDVFLSLTKRNSKNNKSGGIRL